MKKLVIAIITILFSICIPIGCEAASTVPFYVRRKTN